MENEFDLYAEAFLIVRAARLKFLELNKDSANQEIIDAYFKAVRIENYLFSVCAEIHASEIFQGNKKRMNPFNMVSKDTVSKDTVFVEQIV